MERDGWGWVACSLRGAGGGERVLRLRFDEAGGLLAVQGTGKSLEIFR